MAGCAETAMEGREGTAWEVGGSGLSTGDFRLVRQLNPVHPMTDRNRLEYCSGSSSSQKSPWLVFL